MHNFTYWSEHFFEMAFLGYQNAIGFLFWPLIFTAVLAYVYQKSQSLVAVAATILIITAGFGNHLMNVNIYFSILHIFTALILSILVLIFITKMRR